MKLNEILSQPTFKIIEKNVILLSIDGADVNTSTFSSYQKRYFDELAGCIGYIRLDMISYREYAFVDDIFVASEYRGKGYGKSLYNRALQFAKRKGKEALASDDFMRNANSQKVWGAKVQDRDEELDLDLILSPIK